MSHGDFEEVAVNNLFVRDKKCLGSGNRRGGNGFSAGFGDGLAKNAEARICLATRHHVFRLALEIFPVADEAQVGSGELEVDGDFTDGGAGQRVGEQRRAWPADAGAAVPKIHVRGK